MTKVYGTEQDGPEQASPQLPRTQFFAQYRGGGVSALQEGLSDLQKGLKKFAEDQEFKDMGSFIADARAHVRDTQNSVERNIRSERLKQQFLRQFGSKYAEQVKFIDAPDIQKNIDPYANGGQGAIVAKDMETGAVTQTPLVPQVNADQIAHNAIITETSMAGVHAPRVEKYFTNLVTRENGNLDTITGIHQTSFAINNFFGNLERMSTTADVLDHLGPKENMIIDPNVRKKFGSDIENSFYSVLQTFNDPSYLRLVANEKNTVTPEDIVALSELFIQDAMDQIRSTKAAERLGINVNQMRHNAEIMKDYMLKSITAFRERDMKEVQRLSTLRSATLEILKSEWMINLSKQQPEVFSALQAAPAVQAMANMANLSDWLTVISSSPQAAHTRNKITGMLGWIMNQDQNEMMVQQLGHINPNNKTNIQLTLQTVEKIAQNGGGILYANEILSRLEMALENAEIMAAKGEIRKEDVDVIKKERDRYKKEVAAKMKTIDDAEGPGSAEKQRGTVRALMEMIFKNKTTPLPRKE